MKKTIYTSLLLILLAWGCSFEKKYRSFYEFPGDEWNRFENPLIEFNITDPGIYYDMSLKLNYMPSPDLKNFLITVIMTTPAGEVRSRDVELDFGKGKPVDDYARINIILRKGYAFSEKGKCIFEIENRSSDVNTPGMKSIGIFMEKVQ
jgi:hypothetical protein